LGTLDIELKMQVGVFKTSKKQKKKRKNEQKVKKKKKKFGRGIYHKTTTL